MRFLIPLLTGLLLIAHPADATFLDRAMRMQQLAQPSFETIRKLCLAEDLTLKDAGQPIKGLKRTKAYGTDGSAQNYAWNVMLLTGRMMAGNKNAEQELIRLLTTWAKDDAFTESEQVHDAYYAQKRALTPVITAFAYVRPVMNDADRALVAAWLDKVVPVLNHRFNGDVDENNHRSSADAVLMLWGHVSENPALLQIGYDGYRRLLKKMHNDGSLSLETRRGARALWYLRQVLANMTLMLQIAEAHKVDLFHEAVDGKSFVTLLDFFLNAAQSPLLLLPDAAENLIPGPSGNFLQQDSGLFEQRGHGRHYMAFTEALLPYLDDFRAKRLKNLLVRHHIMQKRPLIDEFSGGNTSCLYAE